MATGSDINHVISILARCAAKSIEWANRRGVQFDTAKTEAALFTRRRGHRKHLRPKLTAKIRVGSGIIRFNTQATRCLGVWKDAHLTFKEQHNRCMKKARAAEAGLRTLTKPYGVVPESVRAVQMACVQAAALYGSEVWWDPSEEGRRDDLQLLLNRQARAILGALPTTPQGKLIRESGLTPAPVILDARQQRFAARLANACSSKLKELHHNPSSGAPICQVIREEHEHGRTTEGADWPPRDFKISGQDYHTGRYHRNQERRPMLGKIERSQNRSWGLDVVDRWIALRRWPSGSRSSVETRKSIEVSPQLSGHWTHVGLRRWNVGDQTRAWPGDREERNFADAWSEDGGSLQRLIGRNLTRGTPGAEPSAATGEADQQKRVESPHPQHRN